MCGVSAIFRSSLQAPAPERLRQMNARVAHRGPDGEGEVYLQLLPEARPAQRSEAHGPWQVALGHRRLSIIDLSPLGHQPMERDGVWVVYNGEIYNHIELREELQRLGKVFVSQSDTEVLLAAYQQWGTDAFARLRGMWGLVLVDTRNRRAFLCRDRLGIKPLYVRARARSVEVCSEIKQLEDDEGFRAQPDALNRYLETGYEDASTTFFAGVEPVPPGTFMTLQLDTLERSAPQSYWQPSALADSLTPADAVEAWFEALRESVRLHLRSDVPVGCALSGGLDSGTIAALVKETQSASLHTFTASFPGQWMDERPWVEGVAKAAAAQAHFVNPSAEKLLEELDSFVRTHDEPVGSLSQYAGYCVARLTRENGIPVTLNGQGGDEVLAGYWQSYFVHLRALAKGGHLLELARHVLGALLPGGNPELIRQVPVMARRYFARNAASSASGRETAAQVLEMPEAERRVFEIRHLYLPRLLKWDDRNFMAFSVEGRYPFLDHVVIERSLSLASAVLYRRGWTKEPLRQKAEKRLPPAVVRRREKLGFETPQQSWLAGPLQKALVDWRTRGSAFESKLQNAHFEVAWSRTLRGQASEEQAQAVFRAWMLERWMSVFGVSAAGWV